MNIDSKIGKLLCKTKSTNPFNLVTGNTAIMFSFYSLFFCAVAEKKAASVTE